MTCGNDHIFGHTKLNIIYYKNLLHLFLWLLNASTTKFRITHMTHYISVEH